MDQESHSPDPGSSEKKQPCVDRDGGISVQWVESDAASHGIENRSSPQVVQVDQDSGEQDQRGPHPMGWKGQNTYQYRQQEVYPIMHEFPKHSRGGQVIADMTLPLFLH